MLTRILQSAALAMADLESTYVDLHQHPELAYQEFRTAGVVAEQLRAFGFDVTENVGVTGVIGVLENGPGPRVMARADMDGLPVEEATGLPYASVEATLDEDGGRMPLMHACGHDMHVTCLLGAAQALASTRDAWSGTFVVVFQPAEEGRGGAVAMVDDGLFDIAGVPDVILGQHVFPFTAGTVRCRSGAILAASNAFNIRVFGRGGHGSQPQSTVDPVVLAASIVLRLQTIVSREVAPAERVALTVGSLHAGTAGNIVAEHADLVVSARSFSEDVAQRVVGSIKRIVEAESVASNSPKPAEFEELYGFEPTINDPEATARVTDAMRHLGQDRVHETEPMMGSEDFPELGRKHNVPYVFWFLGGADPDEYDRAAAAGRVEQDVPSNHSPFFAPVIQPTLSTGVNALILSSLAWLAPVLLQEERDDLPTEHSGRVVR